MSQEQNLWGGFVSDKDKALEAGGTSALVFGLNQGVEVTRFEYSTLTGSGNSEGNPAVIIEVLIAGEGKQNTRVWNPNKVYGPNNKELTPDDPNYARNLGQQIISIKGVLTHWVKGLGVTEETIENAFKATPPTNFETLAKLFEGLAKPMLGNKIDLFLHFQKSIRSGADRTFLEIPQNLAFGAFVTSAKPGVFTAKDSFTYKDKEGNVVEEKGLGYVNEQGKQHPFKRDSKYMESTRSKSQSAQALPGANPMGTPSGFAPQAATVGTPAPQQGQPQGNSAEEEEW